MGFFGPLAGARVFDLSVRSESYMTDKKELSAIAVASVGGLLTDDRRHALLKIVREKRDKDGETEFHLAVRSESLPTIAALCLSLTTRAQESVDKKAMIWGDAVELGIAGDDQLMLTFKLKTKANLSVAVDRDQARKLLHHLSSVLEVSGRGETGSRLH